MIHSMQIICCLCLNLSQTKNDACLLQSILTIIFSICSSTDCFLLKKSIMVYFPKLREMSSNAFILSDQQFLDCLRSCSQRVFVVHCFKKYSHHKWFCRWIWIVSADVCHQCCSSHLSHWTKEKHWPKAVKHYVCASCLNHCLNLQLFPFW